MPPRAEIDGALARIQAWPGLSRSPQLAKFLNYIVEARLNGNEAGIKAYSIAVDVFGRPQSFDPQNDPIVRVQARRLRAALREYYAGEGAGETVRFYLPVGRYVPEFGASGDAGPASGGGSAAPQRSWTRQADAPGRPWLARLDDVALLVVLVAVALGIALLLTQVLAPRPTRTPVPQPPSVAVAEFTSVAAGDTPGASVAGLAVELVTDLQLFPFIDAVYLQRAGQAAPQDNPAAFELTGIARAQGSEEQITASLKRSDSDTAVWSKTEKVPVTELPTSIDQLSQAFADQLGALDGPLHADAIKWLETNTDVAGNETEYVCGLLFTLYRETGNADRGDRARSCTTGLLRSQPDSALALGMNASLLLDRALRTQPPARLDPEPMSEAQRQISQALKLAPTSSPVWREYAFFLEDVGRFGESEAAFISALQLNPSNLDALAGYGRLLSLRGKSDKGEKLADEALRRALSPPYWYHAAPAVNALRDGHNASALAHAESLASGDAELASVIGTVAARRMGSQDVLNRYIAQLLEVTRFRRFGILPVLRQRLGDAELRTQIGTELAAAGIDKAALNGPY
ncbi:hypothetical protein [Devosia sp.]|uniref:hypothetical protein n=1 Tax=Devosia sp. TaxID=1871048 RepID=UPI0026336B18|nr:hypothetical protein [Devosia sp.]